MSWPISTYWRTIIFRHGRGKYFYSPDCSISYTVCNFYFYSYSYFYFVSVVGIRWLTFSCHLFLHTFWSPSRISLLFDCSFSPLFFFSFFFSFSFQYSSISNIKYATHKKTVFTYHEFRGTGSRVCGKDSELCGMLPVIIMKENGWQIRWGISGRKSGGR